ncbi:MAG TPA: DegT/DnrJ/EryC1/StrS family aminotransferase [Patescibacteria group bacterium]|nr:DegT/DnrJ/EryC1/StrS family aminotransferase [Patescibacteria group bacterium]
MQVKFVDVKAQYPLVKADILKKFEDIIESAYFVGDAHGKYLGQFEAAFAQFCETKHAIAVNNGTSALWMILRALGVGNGDEVIVPVNTFAATAEAVCLTGAKPVFVDIDEQTYTMKPEAIVPKITDKTKVILPVHLYGQCADMDAILEIAEQHKLIVVEDACQAHGARYKGKRAGSIGVAGAFSCYPGKNLGAWGEGGAISANDDELAEKLRLLRNHGSPQKYQHDIIGGNFRIDELQSAVLATKVEHLDDWSEQRRKNAQLYLQLLADKPGLVLPHVANDCVPVWHLFVVRVKNREPFMDFLTKNDIQVGIHYPTPLHLTQAFSKLGHAKGDFPTAEAVQAEIVSLPLYPELSEAEITYVCQKIDEFFAQ